MSAAGTVTILCSGVHLGVYVPGLLIERRLVRLGVPAEVVVLEEHYKAADREGLERLRDAYHDSFRVALMAHRMTRDTQQSLDDGLVSALLSRWRREDRRRFVVWSGFWLPLLERYRGSLGGAKLEVDHCRIDAVISASFKVHAGSGDQGRVVWFWNGEGGRLEHRIVVDAGPPIPFGDRDDRYVVHGRGWGIGTYRDRLPQLRAAGLALDVIAYREHEAAGRAGDERVFMVDPAWRPWRRSPGERPGFPPFGQVAPSATGFSAGDGRHALFDLVARSRAVISKPGGGTLTDCLESATPLVMLEPYGYAEEASAALWERLGLGVPFERWSASGFSPDLLERCHERLLSARERTPDYCLRLFEQSRTRRPHGAAASPPDAE